jgi:hypothetical protein
MEPSLLKRRLSILILLVVACDSAPGGPAPAVDAASVDDAPAAADVEPDTTPDVSQGHDGPPPAPDARDVRVALCRLDPPTSCPEPPVRYADVAPIVERRCLVCHNGRGPHWPLTSYGHVADWQDTIRAAMLDCSMPPAEAALPMPLEERIALLHWVRCGALP